MGLREVFLFTFSILYLYSKKIGNDCNCFKKEGKNRTMFKIKIMVEHR